MSHRSIALALGGVVLLLLGVVVGQNLERSRRPDAAAPPPPSQGAAPVANRPAVPGPARTQYWISAPERDSTRIGFAALAVLAQGGSFILDRCRAPDYVLPSRPGDPLPIPVPACETLIDGAVLRVGEDQLVVSDGSGVERAIRFSLSGSGASERLVLDLGERIELLPGSKNDLYKRLQDLPGDEPARRRYMERYFAGAGRPAQ